MQINAHRSTAFSPCYVHVKGFVFVFRWLLAPSFCTIETSFYLSLQCGVFLSRLHFHFLPLFVFFLNSLFKFLFMLLFSYLLLFLRIHKARWSLASRRLQWFCTFTFFHFHFQNCFVYFSPILSHLSYCCIWGLAKTDVAWLAADSSSFSRCTFTIWFHFHFLN